MEEEEEEEEEGEGEHEHITGSLVGQSSSVDVQSHRNSHDKAEKVRISLPAPLLSSGSRRGPCTHTSSGWQLPAVGDTELVV